MVHSLSGTSQAVEELHAEVLSPSRVKLSAGVSLGSAGLRLSEGSTQEVHRKYTGMYTGSTQEVHRMFTGMYTGSHVAVHLATEQDEVQDAAAWEVALA